MSNFERAVLENRDDTSRADDKGLTDGETRMLFLIGKLFQT